MELEEWVVNKNSLLMFLYSPQISASAGSTIITSYITFPTTLSSQEETYVEKENIYLSS